MKISIKTTNITLTPDIKEYLDRKLESLKKFIDAADDTVAVDVELGKSSMHHQTGDVFRAEINVFEGKKSYRAVAEGNDLVSALDGMKDQILHSLRNDMDGMKDQILHSLRNDKTKKMTLIKKTGSRLKQFIRRFYKR